MKRWILDEQGSLFLEILAAMAIVTIGLIPVIVGFELSPASLDQAGKQMVALNLARARIEPLHAQGAWATIPGPATADPPNPAYPGYTVSVGSQTRTGLPADLKDVTVTVSWSDVKGIAHAVRLTTSVARRP